ncbi:protein kinase-like domain, Phloem protein 2-like protein [Artemisia annua]|uniref:Protein kinase-like domain, Phloem protein 2-like protein n=1 Tax=Artemisia annua TaxID=35608 RepID=A0A2U1MQT7_ARTAN|nr:protein kinase-like domain, Phloem protein 2-like protein [Artemisia annua]
MHKNIATLFKVASEDLADDDDDLEELDDNTQMKVMSKGYLIYKYEVNESLDKYLSGSTLTWMQRLLDVARALNFIHHGSPNDESMMIHGNIKSSKILLNQNWEPTLHGLRRDMIVKKHGVYHPSNYDGTSQYTDPAYEKTKALSQTSTPSELFCLRSCLGGWRLFQFRMKIIGVLLDLPVRTMNGKHSAI